MKILVLGSEGKVGYSLCELLYKNDIDFIGVNQQQLDLTNPKKIKKYLIAVCPTIIVNAASYNNPTQAENIPSRCYAINRDAVSLLADYCNQYKICFFHLSTYRVFDGKKNEPYHEEDIANPLGVQAVSRYQAEQQIQARCTNHIILRLSWLISVRRNNLLTRLLNQLSSAHEVSVTADQLGCPTSSDDIARVIFAMLQQINCGIQVWGTYHYASTNAVSENSFAETVIPEAARYHPLKVRELKMSKIIHHQGVRPPANASLNCLKIRNTFGIHSRPWKNNLPALIKVYFTHIVS